MLTIGGLAWNKVPFATDAAELGAITESLKDHVFIATHGTDGHAIAYSGILYTTSDVQIAAADTGTAPDTRVWLKAAAPDGSGTIIDVSIGMSTLLSLVCMKLPQLGISKKVPAGARNYSRGSEILPASLPDDGGGLGLAVTILSCPVGGTLDSVLPMEVSLLDGLSRLGAEPFEWQGLSMNAALKSQEWVRSAQIFVAGDAIGAETDPTAWVVNRALFPFLSALAGERVQKAGLLIAAAAGFLNCPHAIGELAAAAMLGPSRAAGVNLSVGSKAELEALRPTADLRDALARARIMSLLEALEALVSLVAGIHPVEVVLSKGRESSAPRGVNSAFGRGASVRTSLNFRMQSSRAAGGGPEAAGGRPEPDGDRGDLPGPAADGPALETGPVLPLGGEALSSSAPAQADAWAPPAAVAGMTLQGVSDVLLRHFVVPFTGTAELLAAVESLAGEVGVDMLATLGVENLPFPTSGRPMLRAFGLGVSRNSAMLLTCGITGAAASAEDGAANVMRLAEEVARQRTARSVAAKGDGALVKSTGESGKNAARAAPMWVLNAAQGFSPEDAADSAGQVFASLRSKDSHAGWSLLGALGRFVCSSGKPVAEQGSKVDLPKGAVDLRSLAHAELAAIIRRGLPSGMHRSIGHEEPDNFSMSAATSSSLKIAGLLCEEFAPVRKLIPFLCQSATGSGVVHGTLSTDKLCDCMRKLAPALDYLVHDILGLLMSEGKSFGVQLQTIVETCVGSFTIVLEDMLDLMDNKILREFGERLRRWVLLPQSEARSAPLPDLLGLVEGSLAFTRLEQEAFSLMMKRQLGVGSSSGGSRGAGSGSSGGRGSSAGTSAGKKTKAAPKANKRKAAAPAAQPGRNKRQNPGQAAGPQQLAPAAPQPGVQGGPGSKHSSSWGTSMTGPQMKELWNAFDAAIASCGPWDKNVPGKPVKPCFHFICLGNGGAGCNGFAGKGGQAACLKRHVVSACEAAKLKAHTFGSGGQMVLTPQQGVFIDSIVA